MRIALTALATCLFAASSASAATILDFSALTDRVAQTTTFLVTFDAPPGLSTPVVGGSFENVVQINIDPLGLMTSANTAVLEDVNIESHWRTVACSAAPVSCADGTYSIHGEGGVRVPRAVPFTVDGNLWSMTVPWALLNDDDGVFTYLLEDAVGGRIRTLWLGENDAFYSTQPEPELQMFAAFALFAAPLEEPPPPQTPVPEPGTLVLTAAGIGVWWRRRHR